MTRLPRRRKPIAGTATLFHTLSSFTLRNLPNSEGGVQYENARHGQAAKKLDNLSLSVALSRWYDRFCMQQPLSLSFSLSLSLFLFYTHTQDFLLIIFDDCHTRASWGLHRERERHAPTFFIVVAVFPFSLFSFSQLLRQSRDCTRPLPLPRLPSVQLSPPRSRTQRALGRWSRPSAASNASQNPSR